MNIGTINIYESEFGPGLYWHRPRPYAGLLDSRWIMLKFGVNPRLILDWVRASEKDRQFYISLIRNVSPGFMNRGMRRAIVRSFNQALQLIFEKGGNPLP